ncbi:MAG TPA: LamG domain-containing protein [archaeon]|nr:LamG domain-containing protein [archaeon]
MVSRKNNSIKFNFFKNSSAQTTIETLIIFSVSLLILTILLGMIFNQLELQRNFEQQKMGEASLKILASEINDAYFLGPGTTKTIIINIPELTNFRKSFIYQNNLLLNVAGTDLLQTTSPIVKGNWPRNSGEYSFKITVFPDFVSLNAEVLDFSPEKIQEKVLQSSQKQVNLVITNNSNEVKNYSFNLTTPNTTKVNITNGYGSNSFSILPLQSIIIPLTLSCAPDSSGTYVSSLNFVSDVSFSYPIILTCESGQEKLSIFPGTKEISNPINIENTEAFLVCNNSSNDFYINLGLIGDINSVALVEDNIFIEKNSCSQIDLNLFSKNVGLYTGQLKISSSGVSSFSNVNIDFFLPPLKYYFKTVEDNNLNNWFSFGNNVTQRSSDGAWVATGELDWNKEKDFIMNGGDWDQNLIAYYKFNSKNQVSENWMILDSVRGNDGNLINGADLNQNGLWDSNAIKFDGVNQYVEVLDNIDLKLSDKLSVFVWINSKDIDQLTQGIIGKYQDGKREWDLRVSQEGISEPQGKISVQFGTETGSYSGRQYSTESHIIENEWVFVGFTFSEGVVKIYFNGIEVASSLFGGSVIPITISNFDAPLTIGQDQGYYFNGLIDEVTIWDKNLSDVEILQLYNSHLSAKFIDKNILDAGMVVDWNSIKINSGFDYGFGELEGVSSVDLNIYSCNDIFCSQKTSSQFIRDLNSGLFVPVSINNSRFIGFDVNFKLFEKYSAYGDYVYAGSFLKDINIEYQ